MGFGTERQGALGVAFALAFSFYRVQHSITSFNEYIEMFIILAQSWIQVTLVQTQTGENQPGLK